jgi:hypothetical protein
MEKDGNNGLTKASMWETTTNQGRMVEASTLGLIRTSTWVLGVTTKLRVLMVFSYGTMVVNTWVVGTSTRCMVKALTNGVTAEFTMASTQTTRRMAMVFTYGLTKELTVDSGRMESSLM